MASESTRGSVSYWLNELKVGNEAAAEVIWQRYFQSLVAIARRNLTPSTKRMADEEDVALSALGSFIRGVDEGKFAQLKDRNDLWRLLLVITLRKAADQRSWEYRQKRGAGKVRGESELHAEARQFSLEEILSQEPTPEVEAMIRDQLGYLFGKLEDPQLKNIALKKMEGHTDEEIAEENGCSRRTVVRKLSVIRQLWIEDVS